MEGTTYQAWFCSNRVGKSQAVGDPIHHNLPLQFTPGRRSPCRPSGIVRRGRGAGRCGRARRSQRLGDLRCQLFGDRLARARKAIQQPLHRIAEILD